jgi:hypothetical protein
VAKFIETDGLVVDCACMLNIVGDGPLLDVHFYSGYYHVTIVIVIRSKRAKYIFSYDFEEIHPFAELQAY